MDFGSFLLILGLLILVGLYISKPLLERTATIVSAEEQELSALQAERDRILTALQELDFDHTLGKIPEESYPNQRKMLLPVLKFMWNTWTQAFDHKMTFSCFATTIGSKTTRFLPQNLVGDHSMSWTNLTMKN